MWGRLWGWRRRRKCETHVRRSVFTSLVISVHINTTVHPEPPCKLVHAIFIEDFLSSFPVELELVIVSSTRANFCKRDRRGERGGGGKEKEKEKGKKERKRKEEKKKRRRKEGGVHSPTRFHYSICVSNHVHRSLSTPAAAATAFRAELRYSIFFFPHLPFFYFRPLPPLLPPPPPLAPPSPPLLPPFVFFSPPPLLSCAFDFC